MDLFGGSLLTHWSFLTFSLTAAVTVQVFKASVWTQARAEGGGRGAWLFWWGRKTLPLHPVVVGALFGLIPGLPLSPQIEATAAASAMYYAAAGLASTWIFSVLKSLARRQGVDLSPSVGPR